MCWSRVVTGRGWGGALISLIAMGNEANGVNSDARSRLAYMTTDALSGFGILMTSLVTGDI